MSARKRETGVNIMCSPLYAIKAVGGNPDDFQIYDGYWNDDSKPVIAGNWNYVGADHYRSTEIMPGVFIKPLRDMRYDSPVRDALNKRDHRLTDVIESMGYEIDWSDQVLLCDGCYKAVPSEDAIVEECEVSCPNCLAEDIPAYIERHQDDYNTAVRDDICDASDLAGEGWEEIEHCLENGMHVGQNDSPKEFYDKWKNNYDHLVFMVERDNNPFTVTFRLFGKNDSEES